MLIERPVRAVRTYTQSLVAAPDKVFPLLCPVRERDWVDGWDPLMVATNSGVAERDCVFITRSDAGEATWMVTEYEPPNRIAFIRVTPGITACRIFIDVLPDGDNRSKARITYEHTALSDEGKDFVEDFTEEHYREMMEQWEASMNRYLERNR